MIEALDKAIQGKSNSFDLTTYSSLTRNDLLTIYQYLKHKTIKFEGDNIAVEGLIPGNYRIVQSNSDITNDRMIKEDYFILKVNTAQAKTISDDIYDREYKAVLFSFGSYFVITMGLLDLSNDVASTSPLLAATMGLFVGTSYGLMGYPINYKKMLAGIVFSEIACGSTCFVNSIVGVTNRTGAYIGIGLTSLFLCVPLSAILLGCIADEPEPTHTLS